MTGTPSAARFAGKVVVVTGAGSGIGQGVAMAFAQEGGAVFGIDIDRVSVERSALACAGASGKFIALTADVSNPEQVSASVAQVLAHGRGVDVLVNNAGINMGKRIAELELPDWNRVFDTNLRSVYLYSKALWPSFVSRRTGVIVNVASVMGQVGGVSAPAYCAAKAGIIMLSRCLAKDGGPQGIRVNSVCPGYIDTPIMDRVLDEDPDPAKARQAIIDKMPLGRMGCVQDIAAAILFLASDDALYISGTELTIDGAVTATQID